MLLKTVKYLIVAVRGLLQSQTLNHYNTFASALTIFIGNVLQCFLPRCLVTLWLEIYI